MAERKNQLLKKKRCLFSFHLIYFLALPYHTCTKWHESENIPFPYTISFPKGQNARDANLKHCSPTGIPMIVIHHMHPAKIHANPPNTPPNINQRIFPNVLISASPLSPLF